jgi:hypothetical protein
MQWIRHSRECGNPEAINLPNNLDSRLRGNDAWKNGDS